MTIALELLLRNKVSWLTKASSGLTKMEWFTEKMSQDTLKLQSYKSYGSRSAPGLCFREGQQWELF